MSTNDVDIKLHGGNAVNETALKEMVSAGVFYGRRKNRTHPRMRQYVLSNRNGVEIINLAKTLDMLEACSAFVRGRLSAGGKPLLVCTQPAFEDLALSFAKEHNCPVVTRRWLGGTLTNHKVILKRIEYFQKMRANLASGAFDKYTKKERLNMEKELAKLTLMVGGIESLTTLPSVILIVDPAVHGTVIREAKHTRVPVVSLVNVDTDPDKIDYYILGNTKSRTSVKWFLDQIGPAVRAGQAAQKSAPSESGSPASR